MVKPTPYQTNTFSVLEASTVGSTKDMLTPQSPAMTQLRTKQVMPEKPLPQPSDLTPVFVHSTALQRGTEIPL